MLLRPFRIKDLGCESVDSFGKIAGRYGQQWTTELGRTVNDISQTAACGFDRLIRHGATRIDVTTILLYS